MDPISDVGASGDSIHDVGVSGDSNHDVERQSLDTDADIRLQIAKHGRFATVCLYFIFPEALIVIEEVEKHVLRGEDQQVAAFMKSYASSFNMTGVAGAIIAQVAISALALTNLETSHWTATAFFISSLVTGCLSVYFSCSISPAFHGLHTAKDVKAFFSRIPQSKGLKRLEAFIASERYQHDLEAWTADMGRMPIIISLSAAFMFVVPRTLLRVALGTLLIGLGIYLGKLYTARLVPSYGSGGALGILISYLASALFGIGSYWILDAFKFLEKKRLEKIRGEDQSQSRDPVPSSLGRGDEMMQPNPILLDAQVHASERVEMITRGNPASLGGCTPEERSSGVQEQQQPLEPNEESLQVSNSEGLPIGDEGRVSPNVEDITLSDETDGMDAPIPPNLCDDVSSNEEVQVEAMESIRTRSETASDLHQILKELLRAQEESLRINQRLLEALSI